MLSEVNVERIMLSEVSGNVDMLVWTISIILLLTLISTCLWTIANESPARMLSTCDNFIHNVNPNEVVHTVLDPLFTDLFCKYFGPRALQCQAKVSVSLTLFRRKIRLGTLN